MVATESETEVLKVCAGEDMPGEYFVRKRIEEKKRSGHRKKELDFQTWQFSDEEICCGWSEPEYDVGEYSDDSSNSWLDNSGYEVSSDLIDSVVMRPKPSPPQDFLETIKPFTGTKKAKRSAKKKLSPNKKWRVLSLEETGFNNSLFPRQPVSNAGDMTGDCPADFYDDFLPSLDIGDKVESKAETSPENSPPTIEKTHVLSLEGQGRNSSLFPWQPVSDTSGEEHFYTKDLLDFEKKFSNFEHLDDFAGSGAERRLRYTKKHRKQKAHKQVKTKLCRSVKTNKGKRLYVKHIVYKRVNLDAKKLHFIPSPSRANTAQKIDCKPAPRGAPRSGRPTPARTDPRTQRHALTAGNIPSALQNSTEMRLIRLLIDLQHREVTPNDYELLLSLDACVKPKTVDAKTLSAFRTETFCDRRDEMCPICMESYSAGNVIKILPCGHGYHEKCIDTWLSNSSMNCPVDGLPVSKR